eukprot:TRINITY_DN54127_c0_g1_i1.p2 TRINITY_DN54127_c0_g1~~TRINITY_DN54127_c0_g1_i1.p2  ORF type:complete len:116 (+),score=16.55 TRINITY_DN54127_c0_g1_i1:60-407(+)
MISSTCSQPWGSAWVCLRSILELLKLAILASAARLVPPEPTPVLAPLMLKMVAEKRAAAGQKRSFATRSATSALEPRLVVLVAAAVDASTTMRQSELLLVTNRGLPQNSGRNWIC